MTEREKKSAFNNPFPYSDTNRRFYTFDYYMRKLFGKKCAKVPIDAGFTCPNIDGKISRGGFAGSYKARFKTDRRTIL